MAENKGVPEGIFSLLDTDLYKLTMQCAIFKNFPTNVVEYAFTNRTPHMRLSQGAVAWLEQQVEKLANIVITTQEVEFLKSKCPYFTPDYLTYLSDFRLRPSEHVTLVLDKVDDTGLGDLHVSVKGLWMETILYEIPLLALTSEAFFKFCDKDWNHDGQQEKAYAKGEVLLKAGCMFSEFGSRRRRDYHTHDLVMKGLCEAAEASRKAGWPGTLTGTSNVHFAMKYGVPPIGTVAHEWFMGIAAITDDYKAANEIGLQYWLACYGEGVLGIALTDTFGSDNFFRAFNNHIPAVTTAIQGQVRTLPSSANTNTTPDTGSMTKTDPLSNAFSNGGNRIQRSSKTYAQVFAGIRQDSGDPVKYIDVARKFYDLAGITDKKAIVFSDSLNIDRCIEYKEIAEKHNFRPSFGVGTFFTNDFTHASDQRKSPPLNIVIKLSSADGHPCIKLSDDVGKNMGKSELVDSVKEEVGYTDREWAEGDEAKRWGKEGDR